MGFSGKAWIFTIVSFLFFFQLSIAQTGGLEISAFLVNPDPPKLNEETAIEIHVTNTGSETSQEFQVLSHVILEGENSNPKATNFWEMEPPLEPNETRVYSYFFVFNQYGNWYVTAGVTEKDQTPANDFKIKYLNVGPVITDPSIQELVVFPISENPNRFFVALTMLNNSEQWHSGGEINISAINTVTGYEILETWNFDTTAPYSSLGYPIPLIVYSGEWEITLTLNPYNVDANLSNNSKTVIATTDLNQNMPYFLDLEYKIIKSIEIFEPNQTYQIPIEVTNFGNFDHGLYYEIDVNILFENQQLETFLYGHRVNAGEKVIHNLSVTIPETDFMTIQISGSNFYNLDSNLENNFDSITVEVIDGNLPNVRFTEPLHVFEENGTYFLEYSAIIDADVNASYNFEIHVTGTQEDPSEVQVVEVYTGANKLIEGEHLLNFVDENRLIAVFLDAKNEIEESDETDNLDSIYVTIQKDEFLPNLIVEQIFVLPIQIPDTNTDSFVVFASIKNIGSEVAGPSVTRLDIKTPYLDTKYLPTIPLWPGERTIVMAEYDFRYEHFPIRVGADFFRNVKESNEEDNILKYPN